MLQGEGEVDVDLQALRIPVANPATWAGGCRMYREIRRADQVGEPAVGLAFDLRGMPGREVTLRGRDVVGVQCCDIPADDVLRRGCSGRHSDLSRSRDRDVARRRVDLGVDLRPSRLHRPVQRFRHPPRPPRRPRKTARSAVAAP